MGTDDAGIPAPDIVVKQDLIPPSVPLSKPPSVSPDSRSIFRKNEQNYQPLAPPSYIVYLVESKMPYRNWQEKRGSIIILAAASITIMLFTVVHLRHLLPRRHHVNVQDCVWLHASDSAACLGLAEERTEPGIIVGKEWL